MFSIISQANVTLVWSLMHPFDLPPKQHIIAVSRSKHMPVGSDNRAVDAGPSRQPFVEPIVDCSSNISPVCFDDRKCNLWDVTSLTATVPSE